MNNTFTENLLIWFETHGRHDLPWQRDPSPYRVWLSEIMLQQTQVNTVIDYYQRFTSKFSSIKSLAEATQDEVLSLWSGLGYYARARNLHRCAQIICSQYQGQFPKTIKELIALPGIGRSTAGAILSFSMNIQAPILDGNVKRVLSRYYAIAAAPTDKVMTQQLWDIALRHTPQQHYAQYNQAIMDLGATVCTRHKPTCLRCPVISQCQAYHQSRIHEFPTSRKTVKIRPKKSAYLLIICNSEGYVWLEKRQPTGIWGGLWSFPECEIGEDLAVWCRQYLHTDILSRQDWPPFNHIFTHFELMIYPVLLKVHSSTLPKIAESAQIWYNLSGLLPGGIPAPVSKLLDQLKGVL